MAPVGASEKTRYMHHGANTCFTCRGFAVPITNQAPFWSNEGDQHPAGYTAVQGGASWSTPPGGTPYVQGFEDWTQPSQPSTNGLDPGNAQSQSAAEAEAQANMSRYRPQINTSNATGSSASFFGTAQSQQQSESSPYGNPYAPRSTNSQTRSSPAMPQSNLQTSPNMPQSSDGPYGSTHTPRQPSTSMQPPSGYQYGANPYPGQQTFQPGYQGFGYQQAPPPSQVPQYGHQQAPHPSQVPQGYAAYYPQGYYPQGYPGFQPLPFGYNPQGFHPGYNPQGFPPQYGYNPQGIQPGHHPQGPQASPSQHGTPRRVVSATAPGTQQQQQVPRVLRAAASTINLRADANTFQPITPGSSAATPRAPAVTPGAPASTLHAQAPATLTSSANELYETTPPPQHRQLAIRGSRVEQRSASKRRAEDDETPTPHSQKYTATDPADVVSQPRGRAGRRSRSTSRQRTTSRPRSASRGRPRTRTAGIRSVDPSVAPENAARFTCTNCEVSRPGAVRVGEREHNAVCTYCDERDEGDESMWLQWCFSGGHAAFARDFASPQSNDCSNCLSHRPATTANLPAVQPNTTSNNLTTERDPLIGLNTNDTARLAAFNAGVQLSSSLQVCHICGEIRVGRAHAPCKKCKPSKTRDPLWTDANLVNPTRSNLPELFYWEEKLLSRVHAHHVVFTCRPGQDSGEITIQLAREGVQAWEIPVQFDKLVGRLVKPSNYTGRQFTEYEDLHMVRREVLMTWMRHLQENHPGYADVHFAWDFVQRLPDESSIFSHITSIDVANTNIHEDQPKHRPLVKAVPSGMSSSAHHFDVMHETRPGAQSDWIIPLRDLNRSRPLFSLAFPSLFPDGRGEFVACRKTQVTFIDWLRHLLMQNGRAFARHVDFMFVAVNVLRDSQIANRAQFFAHKSYDEYSAESLQLAVQHEDAHFLGQILRYGAATLTGTPPWWELRQEELFAMSRAISPPHLFITLTPGYEHWNLPRDQFPIEGEFQTVQQRIRRDPHLAARFFIERIKVFFRTVLKPKFDVTDHWGRFEFQENGLIHWHAVLWCNGAPPTAENTKAAYDAIAAFWGPHVTAQEPSTAPTLRTLLNLVQFHRHSDKCGGPVECKYGFPFNVAGTASVHESKRGIQEFFPRRNRQMLNQYSRAVLMGWQGNIDVTPLTGYDGVLRYISKPHAESRREEVPDRQAVTRALVGRENPVTRAILARMQALVSQMDLQAQQVCTVLMEQPMVMSSRSFVRVDCRSLEDQLRKPSAALRRYMRRPEEHENVSLLDYLTKYVGNSILDAANTRIPIFHPVWNFASQPEEYHRTVLMLHHPFRQGMDEIMEAILHSSTLTHMPRTFSEACREWKGAANHTEPVSAVTVDDSVWQGLLDEVRSRPGVRELGGRAVDTDPVYWRPFLSLQDPYDIFDDELKWWAKQKQPGEEYPADSTPAPAEDDPNEDRHPLQADQQRIYDAVHNHLADEHNGQLLLQVDGGAGVGKSRLIDEICTRIKSNRDDVLKVAISGTAAHNIEGETIAHAFQLSGKTCRPLNALKLNEMRQRMRRVKLMVFDEKSMIGLETFAAINERCKQLWPDHDFLGGKHALLVGDFCQLPPVGEKSLYIKNDLSESEQRGADLYAAFNRSVFLTLPIRSQQDAHLQTILRNLRENQMPLASFERLSQRLVARQPMTVIEQFQNAPRIYYQNDRVDRHNRLEIERHNRPVKLSIAKNFPSEAQTASTAEAANLDQLLPLSIGCRVMLTANLWTDKSLTNGAMGTVRDIVWEPGQAYKEMPRYVMVEFDGYTGNKVYVARNTGERCVPVAPMKRQFRMKGKTQYAFRTQFPITLAYAITVHKSQSQTLEKAVMDISAREFVPGLIYTAVSRMKSLDDFLIEEPFDMGKFTGLSGEVSDARKADEILRREQDWFRRAPLFEPANVEPVPEVDE